MDFTAYPQETGAFVAYPDGTDFDSNEVYSEPVVLVQSGVLAVAVRVEYFSVVALAEGESLNEPDVTLDVWGADATFSEQRLLEALGTSVSENTNAEFVGEIPLQEFAADLDIEVPVFDAQLAGEIPLQQVVVAATHTAPTFQVEATGVVPFQQVAATATQTAPGYNVALVGVLPMQELEADLFTEGGVSTALWLPGPVAPETVWQPGPN